MYETGIKYILGLRIHQGKLFMEPSVFQAAGKNILSNINIKHKISYTSK